MTFPTKLLRLSIGGSLYTTDQWSMNIHFTTAGAVAPAVNLLPACQAFMESVDQFAWNDTAKLGFVKFNEIDHITGKYSDAGGSNAHYPNPELEAIGQASQIPQASTCVTLGTAKARGRGHSGRIYLPGYVAPGVNGHSLAASCVSVANSVATWINAVTLFDPALTAVIWSKIDDSVTPITHVKVGDVVDTQRRRRGSIPEVYHPAVTPID